MTYRCETCGYTSKAPVDGVDVIHDRGYFWCAKCADVTWRFGRPLIEFPSPGKMIPETITHA